MTLFHVMNSESVLQNILLDSAFKLSYCNEIIEFTNYHTKGTYQYNYYIPMVSFAEIDKEVILDKRCTYGNFAIGMTFKWAKQQGLNPVLYLERHSKIANSIKHILNNMKGETRISNNLDKATTILIQSIKNYEGLYKDKNIIFYVENEWRFIPDLNNVHPDYIHVNDFLQTKYKVKPHIIEDEFLLKFNESDIEYIIVETLEQKNAMCELLTRSHKSILCEKVICSEK